MSKPELDLVIPEKCSHCKQIRINCEGHRLIKGAALLICNGFIDKRGNGIINKNTYCPFPIKKKGGKE